MVISVLTIRKKSRYSIKSLDVINQTIVIISKEDSSLIQDSLENIMGNQMILSGLSIHAASLIGYYYGIENQRRRLSTQQLQAQKAKPVNLILHTSKSRYKISCLNRDGSLVYVDNISHRILREKPEIILENKQLLQNFSGSQACYIGILASMRKLTSKKTPAQRQANVYTLRKKYPTPHI